MAGMNPPSTRVLLEGAWSAVGMGTGGAWIGVIGGGSRTAGGSGLGLALGAVVGFLGGRRFLVSILVGTVLGGLLAWFIAGIEKVSFGAGAGAAMGGFLGVQISMLLDVRAARKAAALEASSDEASADSAVIKS